MSLFSIYTVALALLPFFAAAAPTAEQQVQLSPEVVERVKLYEQYAAASYCNANFEARRGRKLSCRTGNCPRVQNAMTETRLSFSETPGTDTSGFVAIDHTNRLIVVAFRGAESWTNILGLINISPSDIDLCAGCQVVTSLHNFWKPVAEDVDREVRLAQYQYPGYQTVTTGHSLGGAIATYAAADLRTRGIPTDLASFGAPRVGNQAYVNHIMLQSPRMGQNLRFVHAGDPVPSIPWSSMGYAHPGPEYIITTNSLDREVGAADIEIKFTPDEDGDATPGLLDNGITDSWQAHAWYFNAVSICYDADGGGFPFSPWAGVPEAVTISQQDSYDIK